jgi:hypothetical protein
MRRLVSASLGMIFLASVLATPLPAAEPVEPSPDEVAADLLFVRPVALSSIIVGSGIFVVGLPFTIPTKNLGLAWKKLVVEPAKYTFAKPLGQLDTPFTMAERGDL